MRLHGYMGGEYVFGTSKGLLSVGTTKTGSMLNFGDYYTPLGQGATFGEAYLDWWKAQAAGGFNDDEKDWFYGMTMIGDPLMRTEAFMVPEPATLALLFVGLAFASIGRRCWRRLSRLMSCARRPGGRTGGIGPIPPKSPCSPEPLPPCCYSSADDGLYQSATKPDTN